MNACSNGSYFAMGHRYAGKLWERKGWQA